MADPAFAQPGGEYIVPDPAMVWSTHDLITGPLVNAEKPCAALDRAHLKLSLRDAGFGVGRKAGTRRNSKAISRASNTASGFEDKSQQISLR